ncbi:MAG: cytochrome b/b6 domain-containing protein, partial [Paraburkholderia sp.]
TVHVLLNYTLLALVAMHILAALKHQFVDRDGLLARMIPFLK